MSAQTVSDLITATLLQSMLDKSEAKSMDTIKVPLMIDVNLKWVELMKTITKDKSIEMGELIESTLMTIFTFGCNACLKDLRSRYEQPIDILTKLFEE